MLYLAHLPTDGLKPVMNKTTKIAESDIAIEPGQPNAIRFSGGRQGKSEAGVYGFWTRKRRVRFFSFSCEDRVANPHRALQRAPHALTDAFQPQRSANKCEATIRALRSISDCSAPLRLV